MTKAKVLKDYGHMIKSISDERGSGDGIWVYLKDGYVWDGETQTVHEDTWKEVYEQMDLVDEEETTPDYEMPYYY